MEKTYASNEQSWWERLPHADRIHLVNRHFSNPDNNVFSLALKAMYYETVLAPKIEDLQLSSDDKLWWNVMRKEQRLRYIQKYNLEQTPATYSSHAIRVMYLQELNSSCTDLQLSKIDKERIRLYLEKKELGEIAAIQDKSIHSIVSTFNRIRKRNQLQNNIVLTVRSIQMGLVNKSTWKQKHLLQRTKLSKREIEVLHLKCLGLSHFEIGRSLAIQTRTVEGHMHLIREKWAISHESELVYKAIQNGLLHVKLDETFRQKKRFHTQSRYLVRCAFPTEQNQSGIRSLLDFN